MKLLLFLISACPLGSFIPPDSSEDWRDDLRALTVDRPIDRGALRSMPSAIQSQLDNAVAAIANGDGIEDFAGLLNGDNPLVRAVVGGRLIERGDAPESIVKRLFRDEKSVVRYAALKASQKTGKYSVGMIETLMSDNDQRISEVATLLVLERQPSRSTELLLSLLDSRFFEDIYESLAPADAKVLRTKARSLRSSSNQNVRRLATNRCKASGWLEELEIRGLLESPDVQSRVFGCHQVDTRTLAESLKGSLTSCLREDGRVVYAAMHAAMHSPIYLPEFRRLLKRTEPQQQILAAFAIAKLDQADGEAVKKLILLAQSNEPDDAVASLAFLRDLGDDPRLADGLDTLRHLVIEPKFAGANGRRLSGEVITESKILFASYSKGRTARYVRWLIEPEPANGFYASLLTSFSGPYGLGDFKPIGDAIVTHTLSESAGLRDAAVTALNRLLVDDAKNVQVDAVGFRHALASKDPSILMAALRVASLLHVERPDLLEQAMRERLESTELDVRIAAANAFASLYPRQTHEVEQVAREAIATVHPLSVELVSRLGDDGVSLIPYLVQAIPAARATAKARRRVYPVWLNAFSRFKPEDVLGPLANGLQHENPDVRGGCAIALGHFVDNPKVVDALSALIGDRAGSRNTVGTCALESLLRCDGRLDHIAPKVISVLKDIAPETHPDHYAAAIRVLARVQSPAPSAFPTLAKYDYVVRTDSTSGQCSHVSRRAFENAVATRTMAPTKHLGLMGFRKIVGSVASGTTWVPMEARVKDGSWEKRNIGVSLTIDYLVEHKIDELIEDLDKALAVPLLHSDYRAELLFGLAMLDTSRDWTSQLELLANSGSARATVRLAELSRTHTATAGQ